MTDGDEPINRRPMEYYRFYLQLLARMRLRFLPGHLDASDIVQDVMLKAIVGQQQFRDKSEDEWLAWLGTVLAETIADAIRDPAKKPMIWDALAMLSADQRTALELRYMQEQPLSLSQIAQHLGRPSEKAVAVLLCRALKKIRCVLSEPA